jgi:WD40 repeat protein
VILQLWDGLSRRRTIRAHIGAVNALQWQPLKTEPTEDERLLASAGDDGAICIWNVQNLDNEPNNTAKYTMTMEDPVLSLSISPDGAFVAGATAEKILVWKVGDTAWPRATWNRTPHRGWQSPKHDAEEDIEPCLGWDAEGQRLVYGLNSRVSDALDQFG